MNYLDKYMESLGFKVRTIISVDGTHSLSYIDERGNESDEAKSLAENYNPLEDFKAAKKKEILEDSNKFMNVAILDKYPRFEVDTWQNQKADAEAYFRDSANVTVTLDALSSQRGKTREETATKILEKSGQFAAFSATYAGERQKLEDLVDLAITVGEVELIKFKSL